MRDSENLAHSLGPFSSRLFDNSYLLPVAERLISGDEGWTQTTLAMALGVVSTNKVRAALGRLSAAQLIAVAPGAGRTKVYTVVDRDHPFWTFVSKLH